MLVENFDLGFRIIQEYRLSAVEIYVTAARAMARQRQIPRLSEFFRYIKVKIDWFFLKVIIFNHFFEKKKATITDEEWDRVLETCIIVFCKELQDLKLAEKFMPMIIDDANKISAFVIRFFFLSFFLFFQQKLI